MRMKLQEIKQEARSLSQGERAELVVSLLDTLGGPAEEVSDEEGYRRDAELESGCVEPMLHEEFVRRVHQDRGR